MSSERQTPQLPRSLDGIHHLKLYTADLENAIAFYTSVLGFKHREHLNHYHPSPPNALYAVILTHPDNAIPPLELRLDPTRAEALAAANLNFITFKTNPNIGMKALEDWAEWLDSKGVKRSPFIQAMTGYIIVFECPDGMKARFYAEVTGQKVQTDPTEDIKKWLDL